MKFLIFYIILFGHVFAEDKTCTEIRYNMAEFKYEYDFYIKHEKKTYDCKVYPHVIYGKLYLLFICRYGRRDGFKDYIFANKCDDEITKVSDIKRFSISTFNNRSEGLSLNYEYNSDSSGIFNNSDSKPIFKFIPIPPSIIPTHHKEIIYLLLARRTSFVDQIRKLADLGYEYEKLADTLKLSYQTISSPIIYCKQRKGTRFINEIEFFPPQNDYYFCKDKDLELDFFKKLIMKYNEIIAMHIRLMDKIERFRSSLKELIEDFQKTYQEKHPDFNLTLKVSHNNLKRKRNATTIDNDVGVSEKKPRIVSDTVPTLPNELEYKPFSGDDSDLFTELQR